MKEVTMEQYARQLQPYAHYHYILNLEGWQIGVLHGLVNLAAKHPHVKKMGPDIQKTTAEIRAWCLQVMESWGFSPDEIDWLDQAEEEEHAANAGSSRSQN